MTRRLAVLATVVALLAGCSGADAEPTRRPAVQPRSRPAAGADAAGSFRSVRGYHATPAPTFVRIPRIGVASPLDRLGRARDGTVQPPSRWQVAGWYDGGPRPGEPGSAVILGHVDSKSGPAVFYRLRDLRRGDQVEVGRADGSWARFVVERVARYPKRWFPTEEVYYPTLTPALRLVTCGGQFDPSTGHYRSNVIAFATLVR